MPWPEVETNPFPYKEPHRLEPEQLRRDILDELGDHLALAAEEEMAKQGQSEQEAWLRAVTRFGDPDAVARRLWWDAMKEGIMRDWIQSGIAVISAAVALMAAIFLVYAVLQMQNSQAQFLSTMKEIGARQADIVQTSQTELLRTLKDMGAQQTQYVQTSQTELISALKELRQDQSPETGGSALDVEIHRGGLDGPPAPGISVTLSGRIGTETAVQAELTTDSDGQAHFFPVPQGTYDLQLDDPQSTMSLNISHSLFAGTGNALRIPVPDIAPAETRFVLKPELPFRDEYLLFITRCEAFTQLGDFRWKRQNYFMAGRQGIYQLAPSAFQEENKRIYLYNNPYNYASCKLDAPQPSMKLLPEASFQISVSPFLRFVKEDKQQGFCPLEWVSSALADAAVEFKSGGTSVLTFEMPKEQINCVYEAMMAYNIVLRWGGVEMGEFADMPATGGFVLDALPIRDIASVICDAPDLVKMTLQVGEHATSDKTVCGGGLSEETYAKSPGTNTAGFLAIRFPDTAQLAQTYPADVRFLFYCKVQDEAKLLPWFGSEWSVTPGASFIAERRDTPDWIAPVDVPSENGRMFFPVTLGNRRVITHNDEASIILKDVTKCVRGEPGMEPAAGLLIGAFTGRAGVFLSDEDPNHGWKSPHLLVVSDTPPKDLCE